MSGLALAVLLVPFVTALTTLAVGHRSDRAVKGIAVGGSGLGLLLGWALALPHLGDAAPLGWSYADTTAIGQRIELAVYVDPLAAVMLALATTVAFLVQVYSLGYLADDPRYPSYTSLVSLFTGAMVGVVLADDLWMLLVGWELMGACSYFLIAHHWELPEARAGAVKAFLMTRTADLGLLFAILLLGDRFGTYRISTILRTVSEVALTRDQMWLPAMLLVVAVLGKSAQVPFHTWLPDAMPGPTPISALIHAATMVAAGVYLVARMYPLFLTAPSALTLLGFVAAVTMLVSALYASVSNDLKRVLAWSTVSQLAYMFGGLAAGAWTAAVLHLLAHGAFKALLFLGAGSVVHAIGGATSMEAMGGLRDKVRTTFVTMTLGFGALAGVAPLAGFFSKDAIVHGVLDEARDGRLLWPSVAWLLLVSMVLTAALTVAYSLRAWLLVFFGTGPASAHEPPATMRVPLIVLAVPTALGGVALFFPSMLGNPGGLFAPRSEAGDLFHWSTAVLMTLVVVASGAVVLLRWRSRGRDLWRAAPPGRRLPVDRLYDAALV
ncbi:MAG: NADH-quinone oxidoreductase subunit L, partial [Nocardioidaceae bacterium]|nr:NADH-quinone oxidoreductase subunit L [Nocardioidaceae bacterium]